jgi:hypothetical protein
VVVGEWHRPWNAHHDLKVYPAGIPKAIHWATDPAGLGQVGCIYTTQGFEFDYVGVILGRDFAYDPKAGQWIGRPNESHDPLVRKAQDFTTLVRQAYRVLLTRGMRGCYVTFLDPATEEFFRSRMETGKAVEYRAPAPPELRVADAPAAVPLTRAAMDLWPVLEPVLARLYDGKHHESLDEARGTANSLAHALEQPDLQGWEADAGLARRMATALARVLGTPVGDPDVERLIEVLRHRSHLA